MCAARRVDRSDRLASRDQREPAAALACAGRWVGDERASDTRKSSTALEAFVPVAISGHDEVQPPAIVVEIKRGPMQVKVSWPMKVSVECGAWLSELMR